MQTSTYSEYYVYEFLNSHGYKSHCIPSVIKSSKNAKKEKK